MIEYLLLNSNPYRNPNLDSKPSQTKTVYTHRNRISNTLGWVPEEVMEVERKHKKIKMRVFSWLNRKTISQIEQFSISIIKWLESKIRKYKKKKK